MIAKINLSADATVTGEGKVECHIEGDVDALVKTMAKLLASIMDKPQAAAILMMALDEI